MVDIFNHLSSLLCPYFNAKVATPHTLCRSFAFIILQNPGGYAA